MARFTNTEMAEFIRLDSLLIRSVQYRGEACLLTIRQQNEHVVTKLERRSDGNVWTPAPADSFPMDLRV